MPHDEDRLERLDVAHHVVDLLLDRRRLALPPGAVDGDERLRVRELHPLPNGLGSKAPEHDVVGSTDPRARQHRHDDLGDHRKVDSDDVALADPPVLKCVREPLDLREQVGVRELPLLAFLAAPEERHAVAVAGLDVAVQAVVGSVQLSAREPFVEGGAGVVEHRVPSLEPIERFGLLRPPRFGVALGLLVDRGVGPQRLLTKMLGRRELLHREQLLERLFECLGLSRHLFVTSACRSGRDGRKARALRPSASCSLKCPAVAVA